MMEHRSLGPALRRRLMEMPEGETVPLRVLVGQFGQHVAPEVAYRRWKQTGGLSVGLLGAIELTREQQVQLGRVRCVAEALQRIGAKFTGARTSPERAYFLPPEARVEVKVTGPSFLSLPTPPQALAHLNKRLPVITQGRSRSWNLDDQRAVRTLMHLAERAITTDLVDSLMEDDSPPRPRTVPTRLGESDINPRLPTPYEQSLRRERS